MKAKRIFLSISFLLSLLLVGCSTRISNITPPTVPTNPSGIYTLSAQAKVKNKVVDHSTIYATIVIDGDEHAMERSDDFGSYFFEYDYEMPEGRDTARFYYVLNYRNKTLTDTHGKLKQVKSGVEEIRLIDRFSISLDANRAPVGTQLAILGRGFSQADIVYVGGTAALTTFVSQNSVQFVVPNLQSGRTYSVEVGTPANLESAGTLRIDPGAAKGPSISSAPRAENNVWTAPVSVTQTGPSVSFSQPISSTGLTIVPDDLNLRTGDKVALAFALDNPAQVGGLYVDITTDIPNAIIMPEVIIPVGARTVNVTLEGAEAASGSLFINAPGFAEQVIPVTIR